VKRLILAAVVLAVLAGGTVWLRAEEKKPTKADIKELMAKTHKGEDSPLGKLGKELKADEPSWDEVQKQVKELNTMAHALADCDDTSKRAGNFQKSVTALDAAATKKDKAAAVEARQMLVKSCSACHYGYPRGSGV
jgi:cytochrome c556